MKARKKDIEYNVLAVVVVQITKHDMVEYSLDIQKERDEALHIFYKINHSLHSYLTYKNMKLNNNENVNKSNDEQKEEINIDKELNKNVFMDGIDPMTGKSIFSASGPSIYDEVDGGSRLLKWKIQQIQYCGVLCHPKYGSHIYPATIFTNYNLENVVEFLNQIDCKELIKYAKEKVAENKYDENNFNQKCC